MTTKGQKITKDAYEDPIVVAKYLEMYGNDFHTDLAKKFARNLSGKKIIDLGCGPGHYCYFFAELGLDVVGLDYSNEMIRIAKNFKKINSQPHFMVGDLRDLEKLFPENSFDGAWSNATLLHVPREETQKVIRGVHFIVKNHGRVLIRTKKGEGTKLVDDTRYGKAIQREYIFWNKNNLKKELELAGFKVDEIIEEREIEKDRETDWLQMFAEVIK